MDGFEQRAPISRASSARPTGGVNRLQGTTDSKSKLWAALPKSGLENNSTDLWVPNDSHEEKMNQIALIPKYTSSPRLF